MNIPSRISISTTATNKLRYLKQQTKVNNNVLSRIAMVAALNSNPNVEAAGVADANGQEFTRDLLFGEQIEAYEIMIRQYMVEHEVNISFAAVISALIEIGVHKIGHVRSLEQLCQVA